MTISKKTKKTGMFIGILSIIMIVVSGVFATGILELGKAERSTP